MRHFRSAILLITVLFAGGVSSARAESEIGVIVLANSGPRTWSKMLARAVREAEMPYPTHIFFGAGDTAAQQSTLQGMVQDLEDAGANTIIVVPIAISPYSQSFRQWKYLLGVDVQPGFNNIPLFPVRKNSTIRFAEPFNDSALVVEILLDRISEISRKPEEECVIVATSGPRDDVDNTQWESVLKNLSARLKERGRFRTVEAATLRDEAPSEKRQEALRRFRQKVEKAQQTGRAIVVPLVLFSSGIEHKISLELRGISYTYNNKALLPDSRISEWIRSQLP